MPQPARIRAAVAQIEDHAPGVRSLLLATERAVPRFQPGQFMHLAIDPYDPASYWPDSRVFSIASPPQLRSEIRITVSAVGAFTWRIMSLKQGDQVWVKLPYGDFVVEPLPGKSIVLIAGGTGITPFISLLASDAPELGPMSVLYGVRTPELLVYSEVLEAARQRWQRFRWHAYVEEDAPAWASPGRLSVAAALSAAEKIGDLQDSVFYLSGPPEMLKSLKEGLTQAGIAAKQIRIDAWE